MKNSWQTAKTYLLIGIGINVFVYIFLWFKITSVVLSEIVLSPEIQKQAGNRYFLGLIIILIYYFFSFRLFKERFTKLEKYFEQQEDASAIKKRGKSYFSLAGRVFLIGVFISILFLIPLLTFCFIKIFKIL